MVVYFILARRQDMSVRIWLLLASLFFYAWWNPKNVFLIIGSMIFNYAFGKVVGKKHSKGLLALGIAANLGVLFYYKYVDFFITNVNNLLGAEWTLLHVVLPLGISFFTFQQIAFLVDSYEGKVGHYKFLDYGLFVSFFPQLVAGPIVHHSELMPQFEDPRNSVININNLLKGLFVFSCGLAKKIIIADTFSVIVNNGYNNVELLNATSAWITSIAYSIQLYFDFSGYSDMAIGLGLMFNINIPINFDSPYRSRNIQEFWRRWHITLSRFLRDYIYIPAGGNRKGEFNTNRNLLLTFVLGGIWHGAGWTFIIWGTLHGSALVFYRYFRRLKFSFPPWLAIVFTFLFVNMAWVFFRAPSWDGAIHMLQAMLGMQHGMEGFSLVNDLYSLPMWVAGIILLFTKNTNELASEFQLTPRFAMRMIVLLMLNMLFLNSVSNQEFLYFDF